MLQLHWSLIYLFFCFWKLYAFLSTWNGRVLPEAFRSRVVRRWAWRGHGPQMSGTLREAEAIREVFLVSELALRAVSLGLCPFSLVGALGVGVDPKAPALVGCPCLPPPALRALPSEPSHRTANGEWRDAGLDTRGN